MPLQAALWSENTTIHLIDPGAGAWGFMTEPAGEGHTILAITVDRLMSDHGIDHIDILKVDIEGAEKEVFADTSAWIDRVDSIIVELHERLKGGCNRSFYNATSGFSPSGCTARMSTFLDLAFSLRYRRMALPTDLEKVWNSAGHNVRLRR